MFWKSSVFAETEQNIGIRFHVNWFSVQAFDSLTRNKLMFLYAETMLSGKSKSTSNYSVQLLIFSNLFTMHMNQPFMHMKIVNVECFPKFIVIDVDLIYAFQFSKLKSTVINTRLTTMLYVCLDSVHCCVH